MDSSVILTPEFLPLAYFSMKPFNYLSGQFNSLLSDWSEFALPLLTRLLTDSSSCPFWISRLARVFRNYVIMRSWYSCTASISALSSSVGVFSSITPSSSVTCSSLVVSTDSSSRSLSQSIFSLFASSSMRASVYDIAAPIVPRFFFICSMASVIFLVYFQLQ